MAKTKNDIQLTNMSDKETSAKTKPKKTKKVETLESKDEPLESKVSQVTEPLDDVKVDVEIDCRSCSNSSNQCVYIRRKRSI